MSRSASWILLAVLAWGGSAGPRARAEDAVPDLMAPWEDDASFLPAGEIDRCVLAALAPAGILPAHRASDAVFLRRVHLDLTGTLPDALAARRFLDDRDPDKRARLVDDLLAGEDYADYWAMKWCDVLRVKAEFPINLWPNAVQAYHRWIRDALRRNVPYDEFARDLLTTSGSNFRVPPVNFLRAVPEKTPAGRASAVALTFLGERLARWPLDRRSGLEALFSRVVTKKTSEWKEEVLLHDPAPQGPLEAVLPDGVRVTVPADADPRKTFADWLLAPGNPWFARAAANRLWAWLFGRGIVHEADDGGPHNPPSNPALLDALAREFVEAKYDVRRLLRTIVLSRTYQQSPIARSDHPRVDALFARYPVRRLEAEVLRDALCALDGAYDAYESIVPEPWTLLPPGQRAVRVADGGISTAFLEAFGRPPRDTGLLAERNDEPTEGQRLYLLNSTDVRRRLERSPRLRALVRATGENPGEGARWIYLHLLSREPTEAEIDAVLVHARRDGLGAPEAALDLAWALVNGKEYLYRH